MTKYRLKKDTPVFSSGYILETDLNDDSVLLDKEGFSAFYKNEIKNFDEWFEVVIDWNKPNFGSGYYHVGDSGVVNYTTWTNDYVDRMRYSMGNCFISEKAAEHYREYLIAKATVLQDEGVLTPGQINKRIENKDLAYFVGYTGKYDTAVELCTCTIYFGDDWLPVGAILFDTKEHADISLKKHLNEWRTLKDTSLRHIGEVYERSGSKNGSK